MFTTPLNLADTLPLTCSRSGTCCHGKQVRLNPWELGCLAGARALTPRAFRDLYTQYGGVQLRFDGAPGWQQLPACSQYQEGLGCRAHGGRPLACRLFPLGRERRGEQVGYMYLGNAFPCLEGCPEVQSLPALRVDAYLAGQGVRRGEAAQDGYLELMQDLAEWAFTLLLDTGLSQSGQARVLKKWRALGDIAPEQLAQRVPELWNDLLMLPEIPLDPEDPASFVRRHRELLMAQAQNAFGSWPRVAQSAAGPIVEASALMMALALQLGRSVGADPQRLAQRWVRDGQGLVAKGPSKS